MFETTLVLFKDTLEENAEFHFGVLLPDENILCLECGGILEPEDYQIMHKYPEIGVVERVLQKHMFKPDNC